MNRVQGYLNSIVDDLASGSRRAAATGANRGDIGTNREALLLRFLQLHLPGRLSAALGGMVIGCDGSESKQVDIIIAHDLGLRFEDGARTFFASEAVASAISVKSRLGSHELADALANLDSLPDPAPEGLEFPALARPSEALDDFLKSHPSRFVFAYDGVEPELLREVLSGALGDRPNDLGLRRTTIIVNGKYTLTHHAQQTET